LVTILGLKKYCIPILIKDTYLKRVINEKSVVFAKRLAFTRGKEEVISKPFEKQKIEWVSTLHKKLIGDKSMFLHLLWPRILKGGLEFWNKNPMMVSIDFLDIKL